MIWRTSTAQLHVIHDNFIWRTNNTVSSKNYVKGSSIVLALLCGWQPNRFIHTLKDYFISQENSSAKDEQQSERSYLPVFNNMMSV